MSTKEAMESKLGGRPSPKRYFDTVISGQPFLLMPTNSPRNEIDVIGLLRFCGPSP